MTAMPRPFAHLHCHTHYSLLDGANRIPDLVRKVKAHGMNSVAITDHGNLYGAMDFYSTCREQGVNPILGYEAYVAPGRRTDRSGATRMKEASFHLTLLAMNRTGFQNLIHLASVAYLEGFYYKPRIDKPLLEEYSEGLICLSGCASSELSHLILGEKWDEAERLTHWFSKVFGDRFYMEIQNAGLPIQRQCLEGTVDLANRMGLPLVATNDAHYLNREDAAAHDVLLCVNTGAARSDTKRMKMDADEFFVRTPEEMYAAFPDFEDACARTQEIADRVDIELDTARHFPVFAPPQGKTDKEYLRELCLEGLTWRYGDGITDAHRQRLDFELDVIDQMGYSSYFLIVWDFVRFAREHKIPCQARGSACGAIVAYVLGLSNVCPLKYDLLFERFLDPSRTEPPDIDIDFCRDRRQLVIDYTKQKYGEQNVSQIGTFGTLKAKMAIRDVGRALAVPLSRVNEVAKMVPDELNIKLSKAIHDSPDLKQAYDGDPQIKELLDIAMRIEGLARSAGTHAAGVVVADEPISKYIPLQRITGKEDIITQWDGPTVELAGLLKMDFLGLRNLTILDKAVENVRRHRGVEIDPDTLPLDDQKTFELLQRGETKGVFQLESGGMRDLLTKMRPDSFQDIVATSALYRPGPLEGGMVMDYVNVKNGRQQAEYKHPIMKEVLEDTYGVMCIHEDARISLADGSEKPIRHVRRGDRVHSLNYETHRFEIKECHGCGPTRRRDGLKITLSNGFSVTLTPDHKVWTYDGFKAAEDLNPETDLVATALSLRQENPSGEPLASWLGADDDVAYFLGQLVGDGCLTGKGLCLATGTAEAHAGLVDWFTRRLPKLHRYEYHHCRSWYLSLSCADLLNAPGYGNRKTRLHHWVEALGLKTRAADKRVPDVIFRCSPNVRAAFLAGLLDSDGCLTQTNVGAAICTFCSVSPALLEDIRRLCQLEGIAVSLRTHRVHVWNQQQFRRVVGPYVQTRTFCGKLHEGASVGWVPRRAVFAAIPAGESQRAFCRRTGIERSALRHPLPFVKSSTALKAGLDLGDVRYYRITSVDRVPDQQFYGMSVADHHNLVADGIVVKNCYQEQVMRILNRLGGIELSSAYKCIKAISKKKLPMIAKYRQEFVQGSLSQGLNGPEAEEIFGLIEKFAGYGFNRSHSTAYGAVAYQTAYLKAHYPVEFMAALLSCEMESSDRIAEHIDDCRRMGIAVLPPDINESEVEFAVIGDKLRFGFGAVKGAGEQAVGAVVAERQENGPFRSIYDLAERVDPKQLTRTVLELLVKAGALDSLGPNREQHLLAAERAVQSALARQRDKARGQKNLFGGDDETEDGADDAAPPPLPDAPDWTHSQKLAAEKEVLGFYLTSHPLTEHADQLGRLATHAAKELVELDDKAEVVLAGLISSIKKAQTKKPSRNGHTRYVNFDFEDPSGIVRCIMWPEEYARLGEKVKPDTICLVKGRVDRRGREPNLIVNQVLSLDEASQQFTEQLAIKFQRGLHSAHDMLRVRDVLSQSPGPTDVVLLIDTADESDPGKRLRYYLATPERYRVSCSSELTAQLAEIVGQSHFRLIASRRNGNGNGPSRGIGR